MTRLRAALVLLLLVALAGLVFRYSRASAQSDALLPVSPAQPVPSRGPLPEAGSQSNAVDASPGAAVSAPGDPESDPRDERAEGSVWSAFPTCQVEILVIDRLGTPVPQALLYRESSEMGWGRHAETDAAGRTQFTLGVRESPQILVRSPFHVGDQKFRIAAGDRDRQEQLVLTGPPAGALRINFTGPHRPQDQPCACVLTRADGSERVAPMVWGGGRPRIVRGLTPGRWNVRVSPVRGITAPTERTVEVAAGETIDVAIELALARVLQGVVVLPDGEAVPGRDPRAWNSGDGGVKVIVEYRWPTGPSAPGSRIMLGGPPTMGSVAPPWDSTETPDYYDIHPDHTRRGARPGADGRFRIGGLPAREVTVRVEREGGIVLTTTVTPGAEPIRLVLPDTPPSLVLRVPDDASARSHWTVAAYRGGRRVAKQSGGAPEVRLRALAAGPYVLWIQSYPSSSHRGDPICGQLTRVDVVSDQSTVVEPGPPAIAWLTVAIVADESGEALERRTLRWRWRGVEIPVDSIPALGWSRAATLIVPAAEALTLLVSAPGRTPVERSVLLAAGERGSDIEVRLRKR